MKTRSLPGARHFKVCLLRSFFAPLMIEQCILEMEIVHPLEKRRPRPTQEALNSSSSQSFLNFVFGLTIPLLLTEKQQEAAAKPRKRRTREEMDEGELNMLAVTILYNNETNIDEHHARQAKTAAVCFDPHKGIRLLTIHNTP